MGIAIEIDKARIEAFCKKWKVREFALFGSVLRDDFPPDSDVDVMVEMEPDDSADMYDWLDMIDELKELFGRDVDLVQKGTIRNPFRRKRIMESYRVMYG